MPNPWKNTPVPKGYETIRERAARFGVSERVVSAQVYRGKICSRRIGGRVLIPVGQRHRSQSSRRAWDGEAYHVAPLLNSQLPCTECKRDRPVLAVEIIDGLPHYTLGECGKMYQRREIDGFLFAVNECGAPEI